jgi:hypothetical protein
MPDILRGLTHKIVNCVPQLALFRPLIKENPGFVVQVQHALLGRL